MKRTIIVILSVVVIIVIAVYMNYKEKITEKNDVLLFNQDYEFYSNQETLLGTDITTLINKATDNNEKKEISKDENGLYVLDDKYSIEIYVHLTSNDSTYKMEAFNEAGINEFTEYFGEMQFKCTDIKYHENTGRVATMTFSSIED